MYVLHIPTQKPRCDRSTAFHDLIFIKRVQEKMEKLRPSTQRSIFGVAFKLNVSQRKPTVTEKKKKKKVKLRNIQFYKNSCGNKLEGKV